MRSLDRFNNFHGEDKRLRAIAALQYGVEYLEDAVRQYQELAEVLSEEPGKRWYLKSKPMAALPLRCGFLRYSKKV